MDIIIPEPVRRALIGFLLLGTLGLHAVFTLDIGEAVLSAENGMPPVNPEIYNYFAGLLAALVATPIAIALGQRPPDLPPDPNPPPKPHTPKPNTPPAPSVPVGVPGLLQTFQVRVARLGARASFQHGGKEKGVAAFTGVIFVLVWLATGAYAVFVWWTNQSEASVALYTQATSFSGIVVGAVAYALRGKSGP